MKLKFLKTEALFNIKGFYTAFKFSRDDKYSFNGEAHDFWEAVFISEGKAISTEDEKIYLLKKNNLLFHAPMEFHRIKSVAGAAPKGIILSFSISGELPDAIKNGVFELSEEEAEEFVFIADKIISLKRNECDDKFLATEICVLFSAFLIKIGTADRAKKTFSATQSALEYKNAAEVMAQNVCNNLSLDEIAKICNVSTSYLKLLFKTYAGIPPKVYYNNLRLTHAKKLLSQGFLTSEVADKMNFSSPNYFTVFFKSATGITPLQYKKQK